MQSLRIVLALLVVGGAIAGLMPSCGPQQRYCPISNPRTGECVEAFDAGSGGSGGSGNSDAGSIFID
jgi:hypothetical protein